MNQANEESCTFESSGWNDICVVTLLGYNGVLVDACKLPVYQSPWCMTSFTGFPIILVQYMSYYIC